MRYRYRYIHFPVARAKVALFRYQLNMMASGSNNVSRPHLQVEVAEMRKLGVIHY